MAKYNEKGEEIPDPRPVESALKFRRPPDIHEIIARALQTRDWQERMRATGRETFEEANDFEVEDDGPEDELALAERAFLMSEEFPKDQVEIAAAARAVQEARSAKQKGGGATPPKPPPAKDSAEAEE